MARVKVDIWSLRSRLLLLVLLAVVPALGLAIHDGLELRRLAVSEATQNARRLARLAAADQERLIEGTHQLLATLAQLPEIRGGDPERCAAVLASVREHQPLYADLGVVDADGKARCTAASAGASEARAPVDVSDRTYFQRALATRSFAVGDYQVGRVTGKPVIPFGYPLLGEAGEPRGVVMASLDLAWFNDFAAQAELPTGSTLTVVDCKGTVLARHPDPDRWLGQKVPEPLLKTLLSRREGVAEVRGLNGAPFLIGFTSPQIPRGDESLHVIVGTPRETAFAQADRMLARSLIGVGAVGIVVLLVAWTGVDLFVLQHVGALLSTTRRLRDGDLTARTGLSRVRGELGQLAAAFDEMAGSLEARTLQLRAIFEALPDLYFRLDSRGTILEYRAGREADLRLTPERVLRRRIVEVLPPDAGRLIERAIAEVVRTKSPATVECSVPFPEGERRLEARLLPFRSSDAPGGPPAIAEGSTPSPAPAHGPCPGIPSAAIPMREDQIVVIARDVTEHRWREERLEYLAAHDCLTGLPNRRTLEEALGRAVLRAQGGEPSALLFLDLDNFKLVNDTLGHVTGDRMLVRLAHRLQRMLTSQDLLVRVGGDEFAALLGGSDLASAQLVAERLRQAVDDSHFVADGQGFNLGLSIGLVVVDGRVDPEVVLAQADAAMYRAKEQGRNRVVVCRPEENHLLQLSQTSQTVALVKRSLREGGFLLHYQPIVRLSDGQTEYYEALVRMRGENGEVMLPGSFIAVAERFGLMPQLTRWVIREVTRTLRSHPDVTLFVNLSTQCVDDDSLLGFVEERLAEHQVEPSRLGFEITETTTIHDFAAAERWIQRLKALGCRFALDDFGRGFSSFLHLRSLPVDQLKIDGSLIRTVESDPTQRAVVRAMQTLAEVMGIEVVAEFVETEATADILRDLGVTFGQGYHLGRPGPGLPRRRRRAGRPEGPKAEGSGRERREEELVLGAR